MFKFFAVSFVFSSFLALAFVVPADIRSWFRDFWPKCLYPVRLISQRAACSSTCCYPKHDRCDDLFASTWRSHTRYDNPPETGFHSDLLFSLHSLVYLCRLRLCRRN